MSEQSEIYAPANRPLEFGQGYATGRGQSLPESLTEDSARWNSAAPHQFRANSVLQQLTPSANAMSAESASRQLPSGELLPSANGQSQGAYDSSNKLFFAGDRELPS